MPSPKRRCGPSRRLDPGWVGAPPMIRVLVVDDQELVRSGLRMLCESAPDLEIIGEARHGQEAIRMVDDHLPDVVLMDLRMPVMDGITATRHILASRPATKVVALTTFDDDDHLYPALAAGAVGLLTKDSSPAELLTAIRRAAAGENPFSTAVLRRLMDRALTTGTAAQARIDELPMLTDRERDVLTHLGSGLPQRGDCRAHVDLGDNREDAPHSRDGQDW